MKGNASKGPNFYNLAAPVEKNAKKLQEVESLAGLLTSLTTEMIL